MGSGYTIGGQIRLIGLAITLPYMEEILKHILYSFKLKLNVSLIQCFLTWIPKMPNPTPLLLYMRENGKLGKMEWKNSNINTFL